MTQNILAYKNSQIAWYRFGSGPQAVICFHGYGETAESFQFLSEKNRDYSFYAIDLPFHGKSIWNEGLIFTHQHLYEIVTAITNNFGGKYFTIGFSLGGRIALSLYQAIPDQVTKMILLAPDGLKVNFWYRVATRTKFGNRIFRFTMKHPGWFFGFLKLVNKLGFVNRSIFKFVNFYIGDEAVRLDLYNRWTSLRKLRPNIPKIKELIQQNDTKVELVYGKHDRIILSSVGEKFRKGIETNCRIEVIEAGHQVLHEKHAEDIISALAH